MPDAAVTGTPEAAGDARAEGSLCPTPQVAVSQVAERMNAQLFRQLAPGAAARLAGRCAKALPRSAKRGKWVQGVGLAEPGQDQTSQQWVLTTTDGRRASQASHVQPSNVQIERNRS